jgi:hypothetical protein
MEMSKMQAGEKNPGGYEMTDSTQPTSSTEGNRLQVDMTMMVTQDLNDHEKPPTNSKHRFPSAASLSSSIWSSSGYSSENSDSYAWSASLGTSDSGSSYSSFSGSDDEESESSDEESEEEATDSFPVKKATPPMPPPMPMPEGLPFGLGLGGLPMSLETLKRDLEKVGRAIISSNAGEVAAERAHTLASINRLASHVPNAVLDHLGHETRALIEEEKGGSVSDESKGSRVASLVTSDAMSDVSDLSNIDLKEFGIEEGNAVDMSVVADLGPVSESYGDLADISQLKVSMYLPTESDPAIPRIVEDEPHGSTKATTQSDLLSMGFLGMLPETDMAMHGQGDQSASMPALEHSFGLDNSERAKFEKRSCVLAEGSQIGIIDMLPQSTGDNEPHNYLSNGGSRNHRRASATEQNGSANFSQRSSLKSFTSPAKGVKGIFKRFTKRRNSNGANPDEPHLPGDQVPQAADRQKLPPNIRPGINGFPNGSSSGADPESTSFSTASIQKSDASQYLAVSSDQDTTSSKKKNAKGKIPGTGLPHSNSYRCALLFADISGFTKLSTLLDPESLSKVSETSTIILCRTDPY